ncbi:MAG: biotin transporter BioY [Lachnospiraceae bacterium]|nr:biotin transporter BioY [Lachnospiraceae bacterium]
MKIKSMATAAVMTALTCIFGPLSIPIGPIPFSLAPLCIMISVYVLGMKRGTLATALYLLIGLTGIPVFSGFTGGPAKLFGPTGGYLVGYILLAAIAGYFIERFPGRYLRQFAGMSLGMAVLYALGTLWLAYSAGMTAGAAFAAGVAPFLLPDLLKIALSIAVGAQVRQRLLAAGVAV